MSDEVSRWLETATRLRRLTANAFAQAREGRQYDPWDWRSLTPADIAFADGLLEGVNSATAGNVRTPAEDLELIQAEFGAGDLGHQQAARFAAWYDWRPSKARRCPRVAAGKRCLASSWPRQDCICDRLRYPLLDHTRIWLDDSGRHVFTAEPYRFDGDEFADLVAACRPLGLLVTVSGTSPYFPGRTCLIIISADREQRPR